MASEEAEAEASVIEGVEASAVEEASVVEEVVDLEAEEEEVEHPEEVEVVLPSKEPDKCCELTPLDNNNISKTMSILL